MTKTFIAPFLAGALALGLAAPGLAQDLPAPVNARIGLMNNMGLNIGILAQMARGNTPYDADAAQAAASNLMVLSQMKLSAYWPEGTDNFVLEGTRALPAIWEDTAGVMQDWADYGAAATALAAVAGTGQEAMAAALGPVGGSCGACHDAYRASE